MQAASQKTYMSKNALAAYKKKRAEVLQKRQAAALS